LNKQVGAALGLSEITVKAHRGHMMRKMKAGSLPELVHMAARLRVGKRIWTASNVGPGYAPPDEKRQARRKSDCRVRVFT
jgi:regulatory LuxR family protein